MITEAAVSLVIAALMIARAINFLVWDLRRAEVCYPLVGANRWGEADLKGTASPMTGIDRRLLATGLLAAAALATTVAATPGRAQAVASRTLASQAAVRHAAATPTCRAWQVVPAKNPGAHLDDFFDVAILSAKSIWAVGDYTAPNDETRTLIEHWDGKAWTQVPSPSPGAGWNVLEHLAVVSATDMWAVGEYSTRSSSPLDIITDKTLVLHWNGHRWSQVRTPSPGGFNDNLTGVAKVSASNIWATGFYGKRNSGNTKSLLLHWNGHAWSQIASPDYGKLNNTLTSVAATAANSVWVTDNVSSGTTSSAGLLLHWNGHGWAKAASLVNADSSSPGLSSPRNGWLVGGDRKGLSLTLHWNGRSWTRVPAPSLKNLSNELLSVTVLSPTSAWAVGFARAVFVGDDTAIEMHWNGHKWSMMASPAPGANSSLSAVQATPATAPWAVGQFGSQFTVQRALVFRCR
jgi:hypothetical protein